MTAPNPLLLLAERVEGLAGPDREIDYAIAFAALPHLHREECSPESLKAMGNPTHDVFHCIFDDGVRRYFFAPPAYTASLDAALSLVPEGWGFGIATTDDRQHTARASVWTEGNQCWRSDESATPALALTAACLRARAAIESSK